MNKRFVFQSENGEEVVYGLEKKMKTEKDEKVVGKACAKSQAEGKEKVKRTPLKKTPVKQTRSKILSGNKKSNRMLKKMFISEVKCNEI